jgi:hypothetical protein
MSTQTQKTMSNLEALALQFAQTLLARSTPNELYCFREVKTRDICHGVKILDLRFFDAFLPQHDSAQVELTIFESQILLNGMEQTEAVTEHLGFEVVTARVKIHEQPWDLFVRPMLQELYAQDKLYLPLTPKDQSTIRGTVVVHDSPTGSSAFVSVVPEGLPLKHGSWRTRRSWTFDDLESYVKCQGAAESEKAVALKEAAVRTMQAELVTLQNVAQIRHRNVRRYRDSKRAG